MKLILQANDVSIALSAFLAENYNISVSPEAITLDLDEVVVEVNPLGETAPEPVKRTRNTKGKGSSTPVAVVDEPVKTEATPEPVEVVADPVEVVEVIAEPTLVEANPFTDETETATSIDTPEDASKSIFD